MMAKCTSTMVHLPNPPERKNPRKSLKYFSTIMLTTRCCRKKKKKKFLAHKRKHRSKRKKSDNGSSLMDVEVEVTQAGQEFCGTGSAWNIFFACFCYRRNPSSIVFNLVN
jgi:hypothetical protein